MRTIYDNAGRIHKQAFLVGFPIYHQSIGVAHSLNKISNLVLFALSVCSACARYYIRIWVQKQFSSDDGILLFGIACLVVAIGLLVTIIDEMYVVGTSESGNLVNVPLPSDFIEQAYEFQKMVTVALILTWCTIVSVKFSYLFLFRRLISRMPRMTAYWWIATVYNALISIYGAIVYGVECPHYYSLKACKYQCTTDFASSSALANTSLSTVRLWERLAQVNRNVRESDGP